MRGKHFLLLFEDAGHFLLEGEELLLVLSPHRSFHRADVLPHLLLVLAADYVLNLDLLLDLLSLLHCNYTLRCSNRLLYRIRTILLLVAPARLLRHLLQLLHIFHRLYLLYQLFRNLLCNLLRSLLRNLPGRKHLLFLNYLVGTLRRHLVLRILRLKHLLHVLRRRVVLTIRSVCIFASLLFFNRLRALYLLNVFSSPLFLNINTIFTLDLVFTFVLLFDVLVDLVILFAQLGLVLQSL